MKMTDHQRATVLKAQNEALTEKQMDFTQYVPYHMQVVNSVAIDTDTYQREVEEDKVRDIVAGFNEYIANEPKLSYRNGKYYAFDGQHTIEARKRLNGNKDCDIVCKVFFGMTPEEEARLFAAQTGTSSKPSAGIKLRAKVIGQDREAINFVNANKAVGIHPSYMNAIGDCRLRCINTALHEYRKVGEKCYKEAMRIIILAWRGKPASLLSEVVKTICTFAKIYDGEYYPKKLAAALSHIDPYEIVKVYLQIGKRGGIKSSLKFVLDCYNANASVQSLPMKF